MRCISGAWLLVALVVYTVYSSKLVAMLAISKEVVPFNTLEEMLAQSQYKFGVHHNTIAQLVLQVCCVATNISQLVGSVCTLFPVL